MSQEINGFDLVTAWDDVGTSAGFASAGGQVTVACQTSEKKDGLAKMGRSDAGAGS